MKPPPEPFTNDVVRCPSCSHGIDPHGVDPGGPCGVDRCPCMWQPNDIAAELTRPKGPEVMKTFTVTRIPDSQSVNLEADGAEFPWHVERDSITYQHSSLMDRLTITLFVEPGGATFPEGWEGVTVEDAEDEPCLPIATLVVRLRLNEEGEEQVFVEQAPSGISLVTLLGMLSLAQDTIIRDRMDENEGEDA